MKKLLSFKNVSPEGINLNYMYQHIDSLIELFYKNINETNPDIIYLITLTKEMKRFQYEWANLDHINPWLSEWLYDESNIAGTDHDADQITQLLKEVLGNMTGHLNDYISHNKL